VAQAAVECGVRVEEVLAEHRDARLLRHPRPVALDERRLEPLRVGIRVEPRDLRQARAALGNQDRRVGGVGVRPARPASAEQPVDHRRSARAVVLHVAVVVMRPREAATRLEADPVELVEQRAREDVERDGQARARDRVRRRGAEQQRRGRVGRGDGLGGLEHPRHDAVDRELAARGVQRPDLGVRLVHRLERDDRLAVALDQELDPARPLAAEVHVGRQLEAAVLERVEPVGELCRAVRPGGEAVGGEDHADPVRARPGDLVVELAHSPCAAASVRRQAGLRLEARPVRPDAHPARAGVEQEVTAAAVVLRAARVDHAVRAEADAAAYRARARLLRPDEPPTAGEPRRAERRRAAFQELTARNESHRVHRNPELPWSRAVSRIAFCTAPDGVSLAYGAHGSGPPLVKAANWLTHMEYDWESPVWRHWLRALGERNTFVRYDERGCGLSDRDIDDKTFSHEVWLADLETVVDAAGLDRFALLGVSQGASLAINYAVHHPDRVTHLVLYGGYVRGRLYRGEEAAEQSQMFHSVIKTGWGQENSAFRRLFTTLFLPDGTPEQMVWFDELQRTSASPETAARIYWAQADTHAIALAKRVHTPTLVLHAQDDA